MSNNAEIIFALWQKETQDKEAKARFTKIVTTQVLDNLIFLFKEKNIDLETVMMFERRSINFLVTEEGRKGGKNKITGRDYKDWVDNVKKFFKAAVGEHYYDSLSDPAPVVKDYYTDQLMQNNMVKKWVKHKFGVLDEAILLETCKHSTSLNLQMQDELFSSSWSMSGENIPDWAK